MKRSAIDELIRAATTCFEAHGWTLPPNPHWDVTDFGLGDWREHGLVLVNLADEPEYCEKLMYARRGMKTPAHTHIRKKEDIICRWGRLSVTLWRYSVGSCESFEVNVNGKPRRIEGGGHLELPAGHRVTLVPGIYHEFVPVSDECIIGEVSTANDDLRDNVFANIDVGRHPTVEDDER